MKILINISIDKHAFNGLYILVQLKEKDEAIRLSLVIN